MSLDIAKYSPRGRVTLFPTLTTDLDNVWKGLFYKAIENNFWIVVMWIYPQETDLLLDNLVTANKT
jgi:hypothetical protein